MIDAGGVQKKRVKCARSRKRKLDQKMVKDQVIQRSFWRVHQRNGKGDIDHSLIPNDIQEWYVDSSDEEETISERESDLETEEPSDNSDHDNEVESY